MSSVGHNTKRLGAEVLQFQTLDEQLVRADRPYAELPMMAGLKAKAREQGLGPEGPQSGPPGLGQPRVAPGRRPEPALDGAIGPRPGRCGAGLADPGDHRTPARGRHS